MDQHYQIDVLTKAKSRIETAIKVRANYLAHADPRDPLVLAEQRTYLAAIAVVNKTITNMQAELRAAMDAELDDNVKQLEARIDQPELFKETK